MVCSASPTKQRSAATGWQTSAMKCCVHACRAWPRLVTKLPNRGLVLRSDANGENCRLHQERAQEHKGYVIKITEHILASEKLKKILS
jgi:hypothetical protein